MRVDQMLGDPRLVRDAFGIEFASRDHGLLHTTIHLVTVHVEIVDGVERELSLVEREAVLHFRDVQQAGIRQRHDAGLHVGGRRLVRGEVHDLHVVQSHGSLGRFDVASDVITLTSGDIGLNHEALNNCRINGTRDHRHHGPQRHGQQGQTPSAPPDAGDEQDRHQQTDENQEVQRGQLGLHVGVRGTLHHAS